MQCYVLVGAKWTSCHAVDVVSEVAIGAGCELDGAAVAGPVAGQAVLVAEEGVGRKMEVHWPQELT